LNILFVLIVIGIAFIGRAVYVAQKIKKDPETKKYGNNPKTAIGTLAIIGAVLFAVGCIGLPVLDSLKPSVYTFDNKSSFVVTIFPEFGEDFKIQNGTLKSFESSHKDMAISYTPSENVEVKKINTRHWEFSNIIESSESRMTFEEFKTAYNKNASEIMNEPINEWEIRDGEKADTASFNGNGYGFLVTLSKGPEYNVTGVMFIFELTEHDETFMLNNFRMYSLVLAIEPNTTVDEAAQFLTQLAENEGEKLISRSNTEYLFQSVQGNIVLSIIL
jgi:hypothetical protein